MINGVVCDLLCASQLRGTDYPELVDLAVIGTGLGILRSNLGFVKRVPSHWDSTQWEAFPRPFLDCQSLAYANALAAWSRGDTAPQWAGDLASEVKRPMLASLKYLTKTNDSFFQPAAEASQLNRPPQDWWKLTASESPSQQVIAIRHCHSDESLSSEQASQVSRLLRSTNRAVVLHAITAAERMTASNEPIVRELQGLVEHRDDEVQAKAMCALATRGQLDEATLESAASMVESNLRHVIFAGVFALSTLDTISETVLTPVDRCFVRALRACDYEFVGLLAAAYRKWLEDPESHVQQLLHRDNPEYLPIALDALHQVPEQLVSIG